MPHHCHAMQCQTPCKPEYLMCGRHWRMVPFHLQSAVYNAYRPGQCDDMNPSTSWWKASDNAIVAVAVSEGRLTAGEAKSYLESRQEFYDKWQAREERAG